ncbi:hypothetical protein [Mycobacterium deserti]|uniref:Secreted protein n=1 Tax=Mycobacterium deserti TaxID=2978347 RepID=A0ABT2M4J1_9MYCO|nr:hypothetical protein [Mycobacterium deserti]MCT7656846.1 hypothetical protein [Mycobacterium deserti]
MNIKKMTASAAIAGALGFAAVGLGAGQAQADDWWWEPPGPGHFIPSPGHIGQLPFVPPPGHIAQLPGVPPPGHWDKPWKWLK